MGTFNSNGLVLFGDVPGLGGTWASPAALPGTPRPRRLRRRVERPQNLI